MLLTISTFFITVLFGYVAHWFLHQPYAGRFNKSHNVHHFELYPPEKFFSEKYLSAGKDSSTFTFLLAGLPLLALPLIACYFGAISLFVACWLVLEMLLVGYAHDYIHDAFHIKNHWMNNIPGFNKLVHLHQIHHQDVQKNFGIFAFWFDKLFKTYKE